MSNTKYNSPGNNGGNNNSNSGDNTGNKAGTTNTSNTTEGTTNQSPNPHIKDKPSLKLNMSKGHNPGGRSLASISNTIPNFGNSGPFSPGIFSSKRVWVKRMNGTATTIMVNQSDIIDDLKLGIMNKFPNALAKFFDPSDLTIKMDLHSRNPVATNSSSSSSTAPPHKKVNIWTLLVSPENPRPVESPIASNFKDRLHISNTNQANSGSHYSYINLEPDQNVWNLLDLYFPGGMNMNEAFIVETPVLEDPFPAPSSGQMGDSLPTNFYPNSSSNIPPYYQSTSPSSNMPNVAANHTSNRSLTPNSVSSVPGYYHQPKPQYMYNTTIDYPGKDRSVSPAMSNTKSSPIPPTANFHRRSQSNPPHSPVVNTNINSNHNNNNKSANSQAVLLLPKNFSLSTATGGHPGTQQPTGTDKKRLSLDENLVNKDRSIASPVDRHDYSNKNHTNLRSEEEEDRDKHFPLIDESKEPRSMSNLSTPERANGHDHDHDHDHDNSRPDGASTPTRTNNDRKSSDNRLSPVDNDRDMSLSPAPQVESEPRLNSPTPDNKDVGLPESSKNENNHVSRQSSGSKKKETNKSKAKTATETVLPSISVLVVEDNAINQAILGAFLRKHKIHYEIAKNGEEAIAKWRKGGFHLVLMDIQLPVKSGIDATKEIRYLERINRIGVFAENELQGPKNLNDLKEDQKLDLKVFRSPVIIVALTASSNSSVDRSNALRAGCNDYLTKPVNLVWLQNKITEWGCMQALIDFDGWKTKRSNFNSSSAKLLAQSTRTRSRSGSQSKVLLGGSSQRHNPMPV